MSILFSAEAAPFYFSTNNAQESPFVPILASMVIFCFLITAILMGMEEYLTVLLICVFLPMSDVEEFFTWYLGAPCISSLEKCLFKFFVHF